MATSGSVSTSKYDGRYYTVSWTATQSVDDNQSTISWTLKAVGGNSSWYAERTLKVVLGGSNVYSKTSRVERYTGTIATGTEVITHDSNGDADFTISIQAAVYVSDVNCTGSSTFTLTNIPRKSTLSVANGTLGTAQTLTVTRKSTSFTHTIVATCGSASTTICTKSTSTSISFTPPLSWASQNTTGTSVTVTYKITTYNGNSSIGSNSYTKTCSIPSSVKPSCKITVTESTSYGAYVKGLSKIKVVVTPTTSYGSAIASYSTSANGSTYTSASFTTGVLSTAGTMTITAKVTDKRGRTGTATATITVVDKSTLSVSNGTLGTAQTVSLTKGHSSFVHKITYACGNTSGYIAGSSSDFISDTSVSWTPDLSLSSQNTTGTSVTVTVYLKTYTSDGTSVGQVSKTIACSIPSSVVPTCAITVTDVMGYADKYGAYVKGKSKFGVVVTPTLAYDSAIASYSASANGLKYTSASFTTDVLSSYGDLTVSATVTDKRSRSGSASKTMAVLDYSAPNISTLKVHRCDEDKTENAQGSYVLVTFSASITALNNKNSASYVLEYKKTSESEDDYKKIEFDFSVLIKYSLSNITCIFEADTGSSYNVRLTASDDFETVTSTTVVSTGYTLIHWLSSGLGMALGKIAELANVLDIGFKTRFFGGVLLMTLESGTDVDTLKTTNTYKVFADDNLLNTPESVDGFLEVIGSEDELTVQQRFNVSDKINPRTYERTFGDDEWGDWIQTTLPIQQIVSAMSTAYKLDTTVTPGENYTSVTGGAYLVGNNLRVSMSAVRNGVANQGNIANEVVASFSVNHGGKIKGMYVGSVSTSATGAALFCINNNKTSGDVCTFNVVLTATIGASEDEFGAYFSMPVTIDISKY